LSVNWYNDWKNIGRIWQKDDGVFGKDNFFNFIPIHHDAIIFALAEDNLFISEIENKLASIHVGELFDVAVDAVVSMEGSNECKNRHEEEWEEFIIEAKHNKAGGYEKAGENNITNEGLSSELNWLFWMFNNLLLID
jgi:hypothetical protein